MRKLIQSLNVTPDGFCDHTAVIADDIEAMLELPEKVGCIKGNV